MDGEEEIKEAQNRALIESFEIQQDFDPDDDKINKNPLATFSRNPDFEKSHAEFLKSFPLDPIEPKAKTFVLEFVSTLLAVGLIMILLFI